jgi:hypothetical protein
MKTFCLKNCLLWLVFGLAAVTARADITFRISVKAVLNPATGLRQSGVSDLVFSNTVVGMNDMLNGHARGYHLQWVGNALINVGGLGQFNTGPSQYYDVDFVNDPDGDALKDEFEANAIANPATYGWSSTAINIYIVRFGGANWNVCSFPNHQIILVNGVAGYSTARTVLHEIGHYFNLSHTFNGRQNLNSNGTSCTNGCNCALLVGGGNDACDDTILDHDCWTDQNDIALGNYGSIYSALTASRQAAVDRIWNNLMSYHGRQHETPYLTPDQLDRWADSANDDRPAVRTGRTRFVDLNCNALAPNGSSICSVLGPYQTVAAGVAGSAANGADIVLIRAGHYDEPQTITKPLTLRATRGTAIIGIP